MRRALLVIPLIVVTLAACGGDSGGAEPEIATPGGGSGPTGGGAVVDPQPPGQAIAVVDGQTYTFTEKGALDCSIASDSITFSFRIGDNEVTLGGGANLYDTGWLGDVPLRVANPEGQDGPVTYSPNLVDNGGGVAIDANSMSYSGPMQMQPPNDGSNPPPVDVGQGTISVTCP